MTAKKKKSIADALDDAYVEAVKEITADVDTDGVKDTVVALGSGCSDSYFSYGEEGTNGEPFVKIGGVNIDLEEISGNDFVKYSKGAASSLRYHIDKPSDLIIPSPRGRINAPYPETEIKFYACKINGRLILLTTGSSLTLEEAPSTAYNNVRWSAGMNTLQYTDKDPIILIYSTIVANHLQTGGTVMLNNSTILSSGSYAVIAEAYIIASTISVGKGLELRNGYIRKSRMQASGFANLEKIRLHDVTFTGVTNLKLNKVENYTDGHFEIAVWGQGMDDLTVSISDITLSPFRFSSGIPTSQLRLYEPTGASNISRKLDITRRLDYGEFSSLSPLRFIRLGEEDIIIEGEVFKSTQFLPKPYIDRKVEESYPRPVQQFGSSPVSPYADTTEVRTRLGKLIFGYSYGTGTDTEIHNSAIDSVYDQIRSRVRLYSQLNGLLKQS